MNSFLRILLLEDNPADAQLILAALEKEGIHCDALRVETGAAFLAAIKNNAFDLILADYMLPAFDGLSALEITRAELRDVPFIFVSGEMGEERAIETLKSGATDYVLKNRLARLAPAVRRALAELRAEQRLHLFSQAIEFSPSIVIITDNEARIEYVNPRFTEVTGYALEEVAGRNPNILKGGATPDDEYKRIWQALQTHGTWHGEFYNRKKNGDYYWASAGITALRDANGNVTHYIGLQQDVTTQKLAEETARANERSLLREQAEREKVEAANRSKSTFLSTMSHEIRTPMNAILGYTQLMLRDPELGINAKANLEIISRSGEHLLALINDILDMAKIDAGSMELKLATFDLPRLLQDLAAMFRLRAQAKGLELEIFVDGEPVQHIVADEGKIRQVLINLIGNAVKFTERGHIKLHLSVNQREDDHLWLSAQIEDTGVGISAEEQETLFQPFTQGQSGLNITGGTGLGLAISQRFIRLMGGDITLSSKPKVGTVLHFEIPVEPGDARRLRRQPARGGPIGLQPGREIPRVLIADDKLDNREWLVKLLTSIGFSVREAENGETAIRSWDEWRPHLILMDVHMPVMDGLEALRRIKTHPAGKETVIVALTASAMADDRQVAFDNGADDFVSKPCREDELLEKIRTHLGLAYVYEEEPTTHETVAPVDVTSAVRPERLRQLPADLINQLLNATLNGNKHDLDTLSLKIKEEGDAQTAQALQELADRYEYDRLIQLLETACQQ